MNIIIELGNINTVKDLLAHLKVIQEQINYFLPCDLSELSTCDLSDSGHYGWHGVEFNNPLNAAGSDTGD